MKTKKINIYLKEEQKHYLTKMAKDYKLSFSTLVDIICFVLIKYRSYIPIINEKKFKEEYLPKGIKTCIKPQCVYLNGFEDSTRTIIIHNLTYIYTMRELDKYVDNITKQKIINSVINECKSREDYYFNYNAQVRSLARATKTNKEYLQRLLKN